MNPITPEHVRAIIKSSLKLKDLPMNETFYTLGFTNQQLILIQNGLTKAFQRTVSSIFFKDTVYSVTERLK